MVVFGLGLESKFGAALLFRRLCGSSSTPVRALETLSHFLTRLDSVRYTHIFTKRRYDDDDDEQHGGFSEANTATASTVEGGDNVRCKGSERRALLEFKAGVVDDFEILSSWGNSSSGNDEEECCDWNGIRCSNITGHVTHLNLPCDYNFYSRLAGEVSPSLGELKHLKYLNLSRNWFSGEIPPQLGNLTNLRFLDLGVNDFYGNIPHHLGNLTKLRALDLRSNYYLKAENLGWVSNLHLLTHLDLRLVNLSSCTSWLNQIPKLSSLAHLRLSDCYLPDPSLPLVNTSFSASNSLAVVDLSFNYFISPNSYNWLFNFTTSLASVDFSFTSFPRSEIPEAFGRIISLQYLSLDYCELEGRLPASFRNFSRLETLSLRFNLFNGSLSEFLHPLATKEKNSLQVLNLRKNQLDGSLPDSLTRFPYLRDITISHNKLSGSFPNNFFQLSSSLVHLDLSYNQIQGQFPNLTLFSSLETMYLNNNELEDTVHEAYLSNLSKLTSLDLSFNSLSLKFSVYWVPPFQLRYILLHNCILGPRFPIWLQSQHNISMLAISSAGISDTIPLWFWDLLTRVRYLNISHNNIHGMLPDLSSMSLPYDYVPHHIDMSFNILTGPIPRLPVNIEYLDLSQNMFTGSLSSLCTTRYKSMTSIHLTDNQLSGELPDCWINFRRLDELNLANNSFSGKLPASIGSLDGVTILQLRNNSLSGELPSSLMNCSELQFLDLSENELFGEVPTWIGTHLTALILFSLSKNNFFGRVPPQLCLLTNVRVVDLSRNNLSRSIPNCVSNFSALVERENHFHSLITFSFENGNQYTTVPGAYVQWKRQESLYAYTLGLLKLIDLSSNRLVGEIPEEFASLTGLISLNLSNNNLNGNIIPNIGHMNNLEVLDLSENNLSGDIPASLSNLTFLNVLDLSKNNLTGRIPLSTQLQSFEPSSYAGNDRLCGLPLPEKCPGHGKNENIEEYEDRFITIWFYISLVLGFVTGFWGFIGPIILRRTWRLGYLRFLEKITEWIYVTTSLSMARLQRKIYG